MRGAGKEQRGQADEQNCGARGLGGNETVRIPVAREGRGTKQSLLTINFLDFSEKLLSKIFSLLYNILPLDLSS